VELLGRVIADKSCLFTVPSLVFLSFKAATLAKFGVAAHLEKWKSPGILKAIGKCWENVCGALSCVM